MHDKLFLYIFYFLRKAGFQIAPTFVAYVFNRTSA